MITDKIKFKPGFVKEDAAYYYFAEAEAEGITPARLWRNLCNISIWNRLNPYIEDIQPLDSADNDPHLFDKMQFNYDMKSGKHIAAQVIFFQNPKDDRPGRLAYQGTLMDDGKEVNEFTVEFLIDVPDQKGRTAVQGAISARDEMCKACREEFGEGLEAMLGNLVKWSERHN